MASTLISPSSDGYETHIKEEEEHQMEITY
jgi:hypothetical protein